jgi:hypothetical protein
VFNHKAFTGRSGTFFGYEGLGSIYWHMVSKLSLAVQEICLQQDPTSAVFKQIKSYYYDINRGIGLHKSPEVYGAFPTDPYSHTPKGRGVQQPGMTGQVKEDFLVRMAELGVRVTDGALYFDTALVPSSEWLTTSGEATFFDVHGRRVALALAPKSLAFTVCQVPVVYEVGEEATLEITLSDGRVIKKAGNALDRTWSEAIFKRTGEVARIAVTITESQRNGL